LVVAFNLYCKIPFGKIDKSNSQIIALATALGRSPSALSWKLANFARLDPALKKRDVSGASHGNRLEQVVWDEFSHAWDALAFESERLMAELLNVSVEESIPDTFPEGITRDSLVRVRVNQGFFRSAVLTSYGCKCCITGIAIPELLCASHIVPWSLDPSNRTNPRNGLCLNALHDRAFDRGLLTVDQDYRVRISPRLSSYADDATKRFIKSYDGEQILLPKRFQPDPALLNHHATSIFRAS
jgi:putative restriction endonuclease